MLTQIPEVGRIDGEPELREVYFHCWSGRQWPLAWRQVSCMVGKKPEHVLETSIDEPSMVQKGVINQV